MQQRVNKNIGKVSEVERMQPWSVAWRCRRGRRWTRAAYCTDRPHNHFFSRGSATGGNPSQDHTRCSLDAAGSWYELQSTVHATATVTT